VNLRSKDRGAWNAILLAFGLFTSAFLVRIANFGFVFVAGRVRFPSGRDELYHVRKIVYQVARFPELLDFDPYVSFPFGARPVWPPYLDWLLAGCMAGLLLALMPAHHVHSQLGQVDHQVVVGLAVTLLLASAMAMLSAQRPARQRRLAVLAGAISAACLLITPGSLPQILPVQGVVIA
jgi:asparagine N-glycosylation enzyme membrane subunit Stt3